MHFTGDWDWVQPRDACTQSANGTLACTWSLMSPQATRLNKGVPPGGPKRYICDNQLHSLEAGEEWGDYHCACGEPLAEPIPPSLISRFGTPWEAAFDRSCNLVTRSNHKANYTGSNSADGVCLHLAAAGARTPFVWKDWKVPPASNAFAVIDGAALTWSCDNQMVDNGDASWLCNCDGALPEQAWNRNIAVRDPCGRAARKEKAAAIIGGSVGGAAVAIIIGLFVAYRAYIARGRSMRSDACSIELQALGTDGQSAPHLVLPHTTLSVQSNSSSEETSSRSVSSSSGIDSHISSPPSSVASDSNLVVPPPVLTSSKVL